MNIDKQQLANKTISVNAPARLHLGFLDMEGGLERKFGSLGLAISDIETALMAEYANDIDIVGPSSNRAVDYAEQVLSHFGINGGIKMRINSAIPGHAGLGSGTQLSLAVASAIARLYGIDAKASELAAVLHRGARSGIGIGTFMHGGFIIDAGRGQNTVVPPIISRLAVPEHWRVLLVFDNEAEGMSGVPERRAFNTLPAMDQHTVGYLCRLTLMQLLPAINENDCGQFGDAITQIQNIVGDYFSEAQGGRFTSPFLATVLEQLKTNNATGLGQSSWGPTGFAFFANETLAFQALQKIRNEWSHQTRLQFMICRPNNHPATVKEMGSQAQLNTTENNTSTVYSNSGTQSS